LDEVKTVSEIIQRGWLTEWLCFASPQLFVGG